jgi:hypothetical protein
MDSNVFPGTVPRCAGYQGTPVLAYGARECARQSAIFSGKSHYFILTKLPNG